MIYRYEDYVCDIYIEEGYFNNLRYRYSLQVTFSDNEQGDTALVIMQNLSMADTHMSDRTVNNVLKALYNKGYKKVIITNLIPFYATHSDEIADDVISSDLKQFYDKNDNIIRSFAKEVEDIYVAYGNRNSFKKDFYNSRIESVRRIIDKPGNNILCFGINKSGNPRHPAIYASSDNIVEYLFS